MPGRRKVAGQESYRTVEYRRRQWENGSIPETCHRRRKKRSHGTALPTPEGGEDAAALSQRFILSENIITTSVELYPPFQWKRVPFQDSHVEFAQGL